MKIVKPKVFIVGKTEIDEEGLQAYLNHIGIPEWTSNAPSGAEKLCEFYGRLCYRSFKPGLNANVTKIREDNREYLQNIAKVRHGSVVEHPVVNFVFADVSRVFTHELVRHRVGTAISQESLRFVRLTDLSFWAPTVISENEQFMEIAVKTFEQLEEVQKGLAAMLELDAEGKLFGDKKIATSAMRRLAPEGLATTIGWSANFRTLRHTLEMRTDPGAEEEIRLVFGEVGRLMQERYPNEFSDYETEMVKGLPWFKTPNRKI